MSKKKIPFLIFLIILSQISVNCQTRISIPAYTGYAVPAEEINEAGESRLFSLKEGVHNWTDTKQQLHYYFKAGNKGNLQQTIHIKKK